MNLTDTPTEEQEELCSCCAQTWRDCECADGKRKRAL